MPPGSATPAVSAAAASSLLACVWSAIIMLAKSLTASLVARSRASELEVISNMSELAAVVANSWALICWARLGLASIRANAAAASNRVFIGIFLSVSVHRTPRTGRGEGCSRSNNPEAESLACEHTAARLYRLATFAGQAHLPLRSFNAHSGVGLGHCCGPQLKHRREAAWVRGSALFSSM